MRAVAVSLFFACFVLVFSFTGHAMGAALNDGKLFNTPLGEGNFIDTRDLDITKFAQRALVRASVLALAEAKQRRAQPSVLAVRRLAFYSGCTPNPNAELLALRAWYDVLAAETAFVHLQQRARQMKQGGCAELINYLRATAQRTTAQAKNIIGQACTLNAGEIEAVEVFILHTPKYFLRSLSAITNTHGFTTCTQTRTLLASLHAQYIAALRAQQLSARTEKTPST